jgi:peroxiredoxin
MLRIILTVLAAAVIGVAAFGAEEELELATASFDDVVAAVRGAHRAGDEGRVKELIDAASAKFGGAYLYFAVGDMYLEDEFSDYARAAAAYEEGLRKVEPSERLEYPGVFYKMACSYARLGDAAKSLDCLRASLEAEPLFVRFARADDDLASLRGEDALADMLAQAEKKAAEKEVENMTVKPGERAPGFELTDIYGRQYRLADFEGKPVVLNVWATWCPPCWDEIPDIIEFAREHDGEVVVLSISVDDATADVAAFAEEHGMNYAVLRDDGEAAAKYIRATGGIPQTYFIDSGGIVRGHIYGSAGRGVFEERFQRLLSSKGE